MADRGTAPRRLAAALTIVLAALAAPRASAVEPDERLEDPALEERAREISKDLRCLVCQNQSIDDSDAPLARDLRLLVRERLVAGDTNEGVIDYVVSRYGDFVLLKPPFRGSTYALWLGPVAILALGGGAMVMFFRRRTAAPAAPQALDEDEQKRLDALLGDEPR